jgi:hypothetical protein
MLVNLWPWVTCHIACTSRGERRVCRQSLRVICSMTWSVAMLCPRVFWHNECIVEDLTRYVTPTWFNRHIVYNGQACWTVHAMPDFIMQRSKKRPCPVTHHLYNLRPIVHNTHIHNALGLESGLLHWWICDVSRTSPSTIAYCYITDDQSVEG